MISEFVSVDIYYSNSINHKRVRISDIISYGFHNYSDGVIYYLKVQGNVDYTSDKLNANNSNNFVAISEWTNLINKLDSILL